VLHASHCEVDWLLYFSCICFIEAALVADSLDSILIRGVRMSWIETGSRYERLKLFDTFVLVPCIPISLKSLNFVFIIRIECP
jgi:hypothetical protein